MTPIFFTNQHQKNTAPVTTTAPPPPPASSTTGGGRGMASELHVNPQMAHIVVPKGTARGAHPVHVTQVPTPPQSPTKPSVSSASAAATSSSKKKNYGIPTDTSNKNFYKTPATTSSIKKKKNVHSTITRKQQNKSASTCSDDTAATSSTAADADADDPPQYTATAVKYPVGLVIYDTSVKDPAIRAIANPLSPCRVTSLCVLKTPSTSTAPAAAAAVTDTTGVDKDHHQITKRWLRQYQSSSSLSSSSLVMPEIDVAGAGAVDTSQHSNDSTGADSSSSTSSAMSGKNNKNHRHVISLFYGDDGYAEMLEKTSIRIVYLIVPTEIQRGYALQALSAAKHLLLNDPVSTSIEDFSEQLFFACKMNRFVQFSTMFVHDHRVQIFMDQVLKNEQFGHIESIDAILTLNYDDLEKVGVLLKSDGGTGLHPGEGCIKRLARYCVLISLLMMSRAGSRPVSAKVTKVKTTMVTAASSSGSLKSISESTPTTADKTNKGEPIRADCVVEFTGNRTLTFHVGYSAAPTRQVLEVRAHDRYATMTDFAIPHRDGLATYRIYDKEMNPVTGQLEVVRGEALDVPCGPPQNVMMWRYFTSLCDAVEQDGWGSGRLTPPPPGSITATPANASDDLPVTEKRHRELAKVAIQTKKLLLALTESFHNDGTEVALDFGVGGDSDVEANARKTCSDDDICDQCFHAAATTIP